MPTRYVASSINYRVSDMTVTAPFNHQRLWQWT